MDRNAPQAARSGAAPGVRVPRLVPLFNPVAKVLLAAGTPMGPNGHASVSCNFLPVNPNLSYARDFANANLKNQHALRLLLT